jgi:hypothetical protein
MLTITHALTADDDACIGGLSAARAESVVFFLTKAERVFEGLEHE